MIINGSFSAEFELFFSVLFQNKNFFGLIFAAKISFPVKEFFSVERRSKVEIKNLLLGHVLTSKSSKFIKLYYNEAPPGTTTMTICAGRCQPV